MPQAIGPIIVATKAAYGAYQVAAAALLAHVGVSAGVSKVIADAALQLAFGTALGAVTAQRPPDPEGGKFNVRQPRPPRRFGVGTCRVSGAAMMKEAQADVLHQVIALPEGPVGHFGKTWLADDEVTIVGNIVQQLADDRYHTGLVELRERLGLATETAYAELVAQYGSVWTSAHRGDGIPSVWLRCKNGGLNDFSRRFPGGAPEVTREAFYVAYDWRHDTTAGGSGPQRRNDPTTWAETSNVVVWTVNILWRRYGQDWDRRFAPSLDLLTVEANVCDEPVSTLAGGSIRRYQIGLWFEGTTPVKSFLATMLAAMDGHFSVRRDGAFLIRAGHYTAPTVIFGEEEIIDWSFTPGPTPDALTNVLTCSFTDPAQGYTQVDCPAWEDEASILIHGEKTNDFFPLGVQSQNQTRRLAKSAMGKAMAPEGFITTPLSARRGLGQRYIGIRLPPEECEDLTDAVIEVLDVSFDFSKATITWTYKLANPDRYAFDAATEEGAPAATQDRPEPVAAVPPVITALDPYTESLGGSDGTRLHIEGSAPDRDDLTWLVQWRVAGSTSWNLTEVTDTDPASSFEGESGFVAAVSGLEVQLGYRTGGGLLVWSATATVDATPPALDFKFTLGEYRLGNVIQAAPAGLAGWSYARTDSPAGSSTKRDSAGVVSAVANGVAPITDRGLLVEPSRTNLALYSTDTSNAEWAVAGASKTTGQADPMGGTGAALITGDGTSGLHYVSCNGSSFSTPYTVGQAYTLRRRVKAGTGSRVQFTPPPPVFGGTLYANFDLTGAGSVTASNGVTAAIERVGTSAWYEISITMPAIATVAGHAGLVLMIAGPTDTRFQTNSLTTTFTAWGASVEAGSPGSGLIVTTSASATRGLPAISVAVPAGVSTYTAIYNGGATATGSVTPGAAFDLVTGRPWLGGRLERLVFA